jgi:antitoxin VapB
MALNIKNSAVEKLVTELAQLMGKSKTEVIKQALEEKKERFFFQRGAGANRTAELLRFLEQEIWSMVPSEELGRAPCKEEVEHLLGYGPEGV